MFQCFQLFACIFNFLCRLSFLFATDVFLEKFQKGFLVRLGRPHRLFTRSNLISSRWILLEFKLIQYFMPVLVTCKFDDDPIKKYRRYRIHSISSGAQGQVTPKSMDGYGWNLIWPKIKLVQDFMPVLVKGVIMSTAFSPL